MSKILFMKMMYKYAFLGLIISVIISCSAAPPAHQDAAPQEIVSAAPPPEPKQDIKPEPVKQPEPAVKKEAPPVQQTPPVQQKPPVKPEPPVEKKEPVPEPKPEPAPVEKQDIIAEFEGVTITKETYVQTKSEIEIVVEQLNRITATKDYTQWIKFLSEEYKYEYSKPETLKIVSEALPVKGIKLKSLKDYFTYVFVPSRQKIRVDDIHFVSPSRVNVIMDQGNVSLLIYGIENVSGTWKLIPPKL
ncbi:MAG: hypothetical protein P1P65_05905 [Treponema sp.]